MVTGPLHYPLPSSMNNSKSKWKLLKIKYKAVIRHPLNQQKRRAYRNNRLNLSSTAISTPSHEAVHHYNEWRHLFEPTGPADYANMVREVISGTLPSLSAIVLLGNESDAALYKCADAIRQQVYPIRSVTLLAPTPLIDSQKAALRTIFAGFNLSFFIEAESISAGGAGAYLILSSSTVLRPHASVTFACRARDSYADIIYCDEDRHSPAGILSSPLFKPSFSPLLAMTTDYLGGCAFLEKSHIATLKNNPHPISVSAILREIIHQAPSIKVDHLPFVLFSDADHISPVWKADTTLLDERIQQTSKELPTISIIIPTRNHLDLVRACVQSLLDITDYPRTHYQIVIVDNGSDDKNILSYLLEGVQRGDFKVIRDDSPFNFSHLNNIAATQSSAEVLVFLNNDTEIIESGWLQRMATVAMQKNTGVVGAKLLYPDHTIQHAGVILGIQGVAGHAHIGLQEDEFGYCGLAKLDREITAITGACVAIRRTVFSEIGGFNEELAVAFNDTALCMATVQKGYRNIILNTVKLLHHESKSRGLDSTPERRKKFLQECKIARSQGNELFHNDPSYNPNLSLERPYELAWPPRTQKPWLRSTENKRLLILSSVHQIGHGVPLVITEHVRYLKNHGFDIIIGGPVTDQDTDYFSCKRAVLSGPQEAMIYAIRNDVDCVIAHTPPFFSSARWAGEFPKVVAYDHGEPPSFFFPDKIEREILDSEKKFSLSIAHQLFANSEVVCAESEQPSMRAIPLGNSHFTGWTESDRARRDALRSHHGWQKSVVVLNVCRFHASERHYKGVDFYIELARKFRKSMASGSPNIVFLLCGKATADDISYAEQQGLTVKANVTNEEMSDLYLAADLYASFSKWEGWNLGIGQALAYGLPVIASDIPAHRINFNIDVIANTEDGSKWLRAQSLAIAADSFSPPRTPIMTQWSSSAEVLGQAILQLFPPIPSTSTREF